MEAIFLFAFVLNLLRFSKRSPLHKTRDNRLERIDRPDARCISVGASDHGHIPARQFGCRSLAHL